MIERDRIERREQQPPWSEPKHLLRGKLSRFVIHLLGLIGISVLYYFGFSLMVDTPVEAELKSRHAGLKREYEKLSQRYDSVEMVLDNVVLRDENVYQILFESKPYNFAGQQNNMRVEMQEELLTKSNRELGGDFMARMESFEQGLNDLRSGYVDVISRFTSMGDSSNYIPSIQPIINKDLTLLTVSFGDRIHPFYKSLSPHNGVDYTIPEGTRVFATADGVVKELRIKQTNTGGISIVIDHQNGYTTTYNHLSKTTVRQYSKVKRGDIIALSGNTGLSIAPHLHYEVAYKGVPVDPLNFFFMELTPEEHQSIVNIANTGMQSLD